MRPPGYINPSGDDEVVDEEDFMPAAVKVCTLMLALLLPGAALANDDTDEPQDPQDTGEEPEEDTDDPADPGPFRGGSTAAELADEEGGMDCTAASGSAAMLLLLPVAALGGRRRYRP